MNAHPLADLYRHAERGYRPQARMRLQGDLPLAGSAALGWSAEQGVEASLRDAISTPRAALCGVVLDRPRVMGILNVTPDSFSDGGRYDALKSAVARARVMAEHVDFIDIGGESTRPGAQTVPQDEEIARVAPVIRALRAEGITTPISIDTRKAKVAEAALDAGGDIINDVTALRYDGNMAALAAERDVPVCLMHSIADPATMQAQAEYEDVCRAVRVHLVERIEAALQAGIAFERLILDPGIGFGKTTAHNIALLQDLGALHALGLPVLLGVSRKRFIGEITQVEEPQARLAGSLAVALSAAQMGVQILRVHDSLETAQALRMWQAMMAPVTEAVAQPE